MPKGRGMLRVHHATALTASETAWLPCASSSSVTATEMGTWEPEMVTVTPPLAEVASTSVLVSSSCSSFTLTPTWAPAERACKTQGRKTRPR